MNWSTNSQLPSDRTVYLSKSIGSDSNDGLSQGSPKYTIQAGLNMVREGTADHLLLRCNDQWTGETFGLHWGKSGRSATQKIVVGSYGTGMRPKIDTVASTWLGSNEAPLSVKHLAFTGLEVYPGSYQGGQEKPNGIGWLGGTEDILFEDCAIHGFFNNAVIQGYPGTARHRDITFRACQFYDAHRTGTLDNPQGLYVSGTDNLLIEDCAFDRNGWIVPDEFTIFRHNVYIQNGCTDVIFRRNIVAGTDGVQIRCGGQITENVFSRLTLALSVGTGNDPEAAGVYGLINDNVFLEGMNDPLGGPAGMGLRIGNLHGGSIRRNIFANGSGNDARVIWFTDPGNTPIGRVAQDVVLSGNIAHDWGGQALCFEGQASGYRNLQLTRNVFQNPTNLRLSSGGIIVSDGPSLSRAQVLSSGNRYSPAVGTSLNACVAHGGGKIPIGNWFNQIGDVRSSTSFTSYFEPGVTLETYSGMDHSDFMSEVCGQSRQTWRDDLTAKRIIEYVKGGFV